jgi:hypothetical protein
MQPAMMHKQIKMTLRSTIDLRPILDVERAACGPVCHAAIVACRQMLVAGRRASHVIDIIKYRWAHFLCIAAHFFREERS